MPHVEEGAQICLLGIYCLRRNLRCPKDYLEQRFRNAQCLRTYPELFSHEVVFSPMRTSPSTGGSPTHGTVMVITIAGA
jgi:hypothetical protein